MLKQGAYSVKQNKEKQTLNEEILPNISGPDMHYQHELCEEFPHHANTKSYTSPLPIPAFCCPLCSLVHAKTNN